MRKQASPTKHLVHIGLATAQILFGISAVVGTVGLPSFHPLTFALVRESSATIILLAAAHVTSNYVGRTGGVLSGSLHDWKLFFVSGLGIFLSQAFYITGIKLSSAVAASVWQPSQPIITAAVCMIIGLEKFSCKRVMSILVAFLGCSIMVLGGGGASGEAIGGSGGDRNSFSKLMGQICFFINCCGSSLYVLASKRILATGRYESVTVTAWSYFTASLLMAIFAILTSWSHGISTFLCSDCEGSIWKVPPSAIPALLWFIVMTSSCCYGLITWANKYATGTLVIGYTVLQPVSSAILIQLLVWFGMYESCGSSDESGGRLLKTLTSLAKPCLDEPDIFTAVGAIAVFAGLLGLIWTEPKAPKGKERSDSDHKSDMELNLLEEKKGLLELTDLGDNE